MSIDDEFLELSIDQIHARYSEKRLRPSELVDFYLRRVYSLDLDTSDGPPVNCIVRVDPTVRAQADAVEAEVTRAGVSKLLHGIPVWVKDNIHVRGLPTSCGCLALDNEPSGQDATVITRLRQAGAIVMGNVGMTELANGASPYSTVSGRIGNAYDPRREPGGSSSGSAVATSMNFGVLAVGVDDCGSIADPAASNGCVGLRPTVGLVSRDGLFAYSASDTTPGPIARSVRDASLMWDAMRENPAGTEPVGSGESPPGNGSLEGTRIGVLESIGRRSFEGVDAAVRRRERERLLMLLERAGAVIVPELTIDDFCLERRSRLEYHNSMVSALRSRAAHPRTLHALASSGRIAPHNVSSSVPFGVARLMPTFPNVFARRYRSIVLRNRHLAKSLMDQHKLDCLAALTGWLPATFATLARSPHLTVPAGLAPRAGETGPSTVRSYLAVGMSLLGAPASERKLLRIGAAFENACGGRQPPDREVPRAHVEFDAEQFDRVKRLISEASVKGLELSSDGYVHPTDEEFRLIVEHVKATVRFEATTRKAMSRSESGA